MQINNNELAGFGRRRRRRGSKRIRVGRKVAPKVVQNRRRFLTWFRKFNPKAYAAVMKRVGLSSMSAEADPVAEPSMWDSIISGAKEVLPMLVQARAQKQIFDAQLTRAKQGLAPLQTSEIAPTIRIETGVTSSTGDMIKKMALPIGLSVAGLAAVLLMRKKS